MRRIAKCTVLFAAMLLCHGSLYSASFAIISVSQDKKPALGISSRPEPTAKKLFTQNCAKCHGADGRGETEAGEILGAPNFTDTKWQASVNDKRLMVSVLHGRGGMPAFEKKLSRKEITALIAYVRAFKK